MKTESFLPLSTPTYAILITLGDSAMHGLGIIEAFEVSTGQQSTLLPGSLYNTVARMMKQGLLDEVDAPAGESDGRKRYYRATDLGVAVAAAETSRLRALIVLADTGRLAAGG